MSAIVTYMKDTQALNRSLIESMAFKCKVNSLRIHTSMELREIN